MSSYEQWLRRFLRFHRMRHPRQMGEAEINAFLSHLATVERVSASTQNQALAALLFPYRTVLGGDVRNLEGVIRARKRQRLPVVLTQPCRLRGSANRRPVTPSAIRLPRIYLSRAPTSIRFRNCSVLAM
jgi:hypothetical protein